jgi:hypothetical protein
MNPSLSFRLLPLPSSLATMSVPASTRSILVTTPCRAGGGRGVLMGAYGWRVPGIPESRNPGWPGGWGARCREGGPPRHQLAGDERCLGPESCRHASKSIPRHSHHFTYKSLPSSAAHGRLPRPISLPPWRPPIPHPHPPNPQHSPWSYRALGRAPLPA